MKIAVNNFDELIRSMYDETIDEIELSAFKNYKANQASQVILNPYDENNIRIINRKLNIYSDDGQAIIDLQHYGSLGYFGVIFKEDPDHPKRPVLPIKDKDGNWMFPQVTFRNIYFKNASNKNNILRENHQKYILGGLFTIKTNEHPLYKNVGGAVLSFDNCSFSGSESYINSLMYIGAGEVYFKDCYFVKNSTVEEFSLEETNRFLLPCLIKTRYVVSDSYFTIDGPDNLNIDLEYDFNIKLLSENKYGRYIGAKNCDVILYVNGEDQGTFQTDENGEFIFKYIFKSGGVHTFKCVFLGTEIYGAAELSKNFEVNKLKTYMVGGEDANGYYLKLCACPPTKKYDATIYVKDKDGNAVVGQIVDIDKNNGQYDATIYVKDKDGNAVVGQIVDIDKNNGQYDATIILKDNNGNPVIGQLVDINRNSGSARATLIVKDSNNNPVVDKLITINEDSGSARATLIVKDSNNNPVVDKLITINEDIPTDYCSRSYDAVLIVKDNNGNPVVGQPVTVHHHGINPDNGCTGIPDKEIIFIINDKTYNQKTNEEGKIYLPADIIQSGILIIAYFMGDNGYLPSDLDGTVDFDKYSVIIKDIKTIQNYPIINIEGILSDFNNNPIINGYINFKIDNIITIVQTNSEGKFIAQLKATTPGSKMIEIKYNGDSKHFKYDTTITVVLSQKSLIFSDIKEIYDRQGLDIINLSLETILKTTSGDIVPNNFCVLYRSNGDLCDSGFTDENGKIVLKHKLISGNDINYILMSQPYNNMSGANLAYRLTGV